MLPVMQDYYHPGNGSSSNRVQEFAAFSNDVPAYLASNDEAMEVPGAWSYWEARDLVQFPESTAFLAQYDYRIGIGNQEKGNFFGESLDLQIPIVFDEYIVSINFADAVVQEAWLDELRKTK